jgi:DNA-binding transcriptional ArsR family regulator
MSPGFRSLMWYLLYGTRGGPNRLRIVGELERRPANAHQLAGSLALDYRTVRHHLRLLERSGAVARPVGDEYAAPYELSPYFMTHFEELRGLASVRQRSTAALVRKRRPLTSTEGAR